MARTVYCVKLGREAEGLAFAPWPGELGKRIYEHVSKEACEVEKYFFGEGSEKPAGYVEPEKSD